MEIIDHILHDDLGTVEYRPTKNFDNTVNQNFLVMHCTATTGSLETNAKSMLRENYKASAHLLIGRDGRIVQFVPFNRRAWHANPGDWDFIKENINRWSLGIELLNAGDLDRIGEDQWGKNGEVIPDDDRVFLQHRLRNSPDWWQTYPKAQFDAALSVAQLLFQHYQTLEDVVSHDEVSPERRVDPGPAFDMQSFHAKVLGLDESIPIKMVHKTARISDLRNGPGTNYEKTDGGRLQKNIPVGILGEQGDWLRVHVLVEIDGNPEIVGWLEKERIILDSLKPRHYHQPAHLNDDSQNI